MSEMKDRVKAAIAEKFATAIDFNAPYAKVMLDMATTAAIEAMREPTEGMKQSGAMVMPDYDPDVNDAAQCWDAMIDEALK